MKHNKHLLFFIITVVLVVVSGCHSQATPGVTSPQDTVAPTGTSAAIPPTQEAEDMPSMLTVDTVHQIDRLQTFTGHESHVWGIDFSTDGSLLASGSHDYMAKIWQVANGQEIQTFEAAYGDIGHGIAFAPSGVSTGNGQLLASITPDNQVKIWNITRGQEVHVLDTPSVLDNLAFSPDGKYLALGLADGTVSIWDVTTWQETKRFGQFEDAVCSITFSPDSTLLAAGSANTDYRIKVWDIASEQEIHTLEGHQGNIYTLRFSSDSALLASASGDRTMRLWDMAKGQEIQTFEGHYDKVMGVDISPDSTLLVSVSANSDHTIRLWNAATGELLRTISYPDELSAVAFSPDGTHFAVAGFDNVVSLWGVSPTTNPDPTVTPTPVATSTPEGPPLTWKEVYGSSRTELASDILLAGDGGIFMLGTTEIRKGALSHQDMYLIRTDANGELLWEKTYGGEGDEKGLGISYTQDGDLLLAGSTTSFGDSTDAYLVVVDKDGNELSSTTTGSDLDEIAKTAWTTADGDYIISGYIVDPNDIVADPGAAGYGGFEGRCNVYLARVDTEGNEVWSRTFGGDNNVLISDSILMPDGSSLILTNILYYPEQDNDIYLFKVDAEGNEVWSRTWEQDISLGYDIIHTTDDNYVIAGSYETKDNSENAKSDYWFIKVDAEGNEIWSNIFGSPDWLNDTHVLAETTAGGFIAVGERVKDYYSWNGDIALIKIDAEGQQEWEQYIPTHTHNMFAGVLEDTEGGYLIAGSTARGRNFDIFLMKTDTEGNLEGGW